LQAGPNPYLYVDANPLRWIDPLGLCKCKYSGKGPYDQPPYYFERPHVFGLWYTSFFTCKYQCTADDGGSSDEVTSDQFFWYFNRRDVRNNVCPKAFTFTPQYDFAGFQTGYLEIPVGDFDPRGSDISELEQWASQNCKDCK
jgi:hypothetical protein